MRELLTFDDVLIQPEFSTIKSRSEVSLDTSFYPVVENDRGACDYVYSLPVVSSNMDTVTGPAMASAMTYDGGAGCLPRFCTIEENVKAYKESPMSTWCSIGLGYDEVQRATALYEAGCRVFVIDVAHAAQLQVVEQYKTVKDRLPGIFLIVGNFASRPSLSEFMHRLGYTPDGIKIGVGPGSACTTRVKTGVGTPQLSAILEIKSLFEPVHFPTFKGEWGTAPAPREPFIIADGGMRTPGDIAKALAAGAHMVMLGGMLAGTDETPQYQEYLNTKWPGKRPPSPEYLTYRGSASQESYDAQGKYSRFRTAEGESFTVPHKGTVTNILQDIEGGLRSAFTYVGARTLAEFQSNATFVKVSASTLKENGAHGKK